MLSIIKFQLTSSSSSVVDDGVFNVVVAIASRIFDGLSFASILTFFSTAVLTGSSESNGKEADKSLILKLIKLFNVVVETHSIIRQT